MPTYDFSPQPFSKKAWDYFYQLSSIPRPSSHEEAVRQWLIKLATEKGWTYRIDNVKNIVLKIEGRGKLASHTPLIIQGHMDMVCEKSEGVDHDFMKDGLKLFSKDGWVYASQTTLGADNGVAIAYGLALADEELEDKLPLELLFTVAEETGLIGATQFDPSLVTGKSMLNLDTEEENNIVIGCAGGEMLKIDFEVLEIENQQVLNCDLNGLKGGHSGLNVETRHNALTQVAKILKNLPTVKLHSISAGTMTNAISRRCQFAISGVTTQQVKKASQSILDQIKLTEKDAQLTITEGKSSMILQNGAIDFLKEFKNGVRQYHPDFPEIIQTSCTMSVAKMDEKRISFFINTRSSSETEKREVNDSIEAEAIHSNSPKVKRYDNYPGWEPNRESLILQNCLKTLHKTSGKTVKISSIHAGLECGILGEKIKIYEIISMGPTIEHPHSPEERLNIDSFERVYAFLIQFVQSSIT